MPSEARPPFTQSEMQRIIMAISHLHEFHDGYVHSQHMFDLGAASRPLTRFFVTALTTYICGMYPPDRNQGLLPVLRLVGCNTLADEIEAGLDTLIGTSPYVRILRDVRNKAFAHPMYTKDSMKKVVAHRDTNLSSPKDRDVFNAADHQVKRATAAAYQYLKRAYPALAEQADEPPMENPA